MIEVYGFFIAFAAQVLALSVIYPLLFSRYVRRHARSVPHERLEKLYPGVDLDQARERFLGRFRAVNWVVAVIGLALLGWLVNYMRSPNWNDGIAITLTAGFFMLQFLPSIFVAWLGFRLNRTVRKAWVEAKRKATLHRRSLFDFVSPVIVFLTVALYLAIIPFIILVQQKPWPGYALLIVLTLTALMQSVVIYRALYGKKPNPLEAPELRTHRISMTVKTGVYGILLCTLFFAFVFLVDLLDMKRWVPMAQTICVLFSSLFCLMIVSRPDRESGTDDTPAISPSH